MIPKKIHYCWFGNNPIPEKDKKNFDSWKKFCPDYEILEWNETNYDVSKIPYIKEAYQCKKYAFVSDYARLDILYNHGGIYMDTDVEIIKSIDFVLDNEAFCGREKNSKVGLGLISGSVKGLPIIKDLMEYYHDKSFYDEEGQMNLTPIGEYTDAVLIPKGMVLEDVMQVIEGMRIYPSSYFDPYDFYTGKAVSDEAIKKAYCIHHYNATWLDSDRKEIIEKGRLIADKYGVKAFYSGKAERIEIIKNDAIQVQKEKGFLYALMWKIKNYYLLIKKQ